ncbi:MAG: helix-turn-helix transcriptional regulator [Pirellulaceae bacterium]
MEKSIFSREYKAVTILLREAREEAGLTQVGLAERLSVTQSYLSKVERGERLLDVIQLRQYCIAVEIDLVAFVKKLEKRLATG